jgi:type IV pilus assembly protein PilB
MKSMKKKIGQILMEEGLVTQKQIDNALLFQKGKNKKLGKILIEIGYVTGEQVAAALSSQMTIPLVDCSDFTITNELKSVVSKDIAEKKMVFPLGMSRKKLLIAMADPLDWQSSDEIAFRTGMNVLVMVAPETNILDAIEKNYGSSDHVWDILKEIPAYERVEFVKDHKEDEVDITSTESMFKMSAAPPIVKLVTMIMADAVKARASDIHFEAGSKYVQVRYRIDGDLREILRYPKRIQNPVISRIKIISNLDITNRRLPQDGRSTLRVEDRDIDLRISTMPSAYGEKIVIRLLDRIAGLKSLVGLGISDIIFKPMIDMFSAPQGMILVTGPTGSGKSTTLYAVLQQMRTEKENIISIEDPVEYKIKGITQIEVNEGTGLSFPVALRSVFRQDPDIIMIGEVRDLETAEIAVRSALTGHLVLSTLHTNDAVSSITRLLDIGVPAYLVNSAIMGILAQRLVKKICVNCRTDIEPPVELLKNIHLPLSNSYRGTGCRECNYTGYSGRVGVFEFLKVNPEIRSLITRFTNEDDLWDAARESGAVTLFDDAWQKVDKGITTVEEVIAKIPYRFFDERTGRTRKKRRTKILLYNLADNERDTVRAILEPEGYRILAGSGGDILQEVVKDAPAMVIVNASDDEYPQVRELRKNIRGACTPVFAIKDRDNGGNEEKGFDSGIRAFINRPVTAEKMFNIMDSLVA